MPQPFTEGVQPVIDEARIEELTTRAISEIYPSAGELAEELRSGRQLTAYMGIDPTAPDMHVGHESQLLKLRRLQDMGHHVILLIGDFTAMIGDPTDKSAARTRLTREQVLENAQGYKQQAGKILDFEDPKNPVDLRYNSEWLDGMNFTDVLELASEFSVQQMLERDMFQQRIKDEKSLNLIEILYPLMQAWDSVQLDVDIEVGGSDQIFNMLKGTTLVKRHLDKQKYVIAGQLLADPDGKKIGKTEGNMITLNDTPADMYHKIMMWGDGITPHALELCTDMPIEEVRDIEQKLRDSTLSGIEAKMLLARTIVTDLHGQESAQEAERGYQALTSRDVEIDLETLPVASVALGQNIVDILVGSGLAPSNKQARRLLEANAVRVNGQAVSADWAATTIEEGQTVVLQVGKKKRENHRVLKVQED